MKEEKKNEEEATLGSEGLSGYFSRGDIAF